MSFRFWRRIKIAPGVTLNLSKSGGSLSFGTRGAKFTLGPRGRRATLGIPGTGLFYTTQMGAGAGGSRRGSSRSSAPIVPAESRLSLGFFRRLVTPDDEKALVDGCRELVAGNEKGAYAHFENATHLADGAYLAGFLALQQERFEEAAKHLGAAAKGYRRLGRYFSRYAISATMSLPITAEICAHVGADLRGVLLGLVEVHQRLGQRQQALKCLERLRRIEPEDVVMKLSLAELLMEGDAAERDVCRRVVRLGEGVTNDTAVHAALLLYRARALRGLGLQDAARDTLSVALRRKKGRSEDLLRAIRYERALVYEAQGKPRRARSDFERLYAEAPGYEDVAARLGL